MPQTKGGTKQWSTITKIRIIFQLKKYYTILNWGTFKISIENNLLTILTTMGTKFIVNPILPYV